MFFRRARVFAQPNRVAVRASVLCPCLSRNAISSRKPIVTTATTKPASRPPMIETTIVMPAPTKRTPVPIAPRPSRPGDFGRVQLP